MKQIELVESTHLKKDIPKFKSGDLLRIYVKIREEDKTRIQAFEGTVIARRGKSLNATFIVRKVSYGEGAERTFLLHSPSIDKIEVLRSGKAKRAKLYYLRKTSGKKTKIAQKVEKE